MKKTKKKESKRKTPAKLKREVRALGREVGILGGKSLLPVIPAEDGVMDERPLREPLRRPKAPRMGREKRRASGAHRSKQGASIVH
jgi:hypothetical protein